MRDATHDEDAVQDGIDEMPAPRLGHVVRLETGATPALVIAIRSTTSAGDAHEHVVARLAGGAAVCRRRHRWLSADPDLIRLWARYSDLLGAETAAMALDAEVTAWRRACRERSLEEREELNRKRRKAEARERKRNAVEAWLVDDRKAGFGIEFRRGDAPLLVILFRERWERERFRDWLRCQRDRFEDFATQAEAGLGVELERAMLREMLDTERRVKQAGLSAGGRRPLRFYRGEGA